LLINAWASPRPGGPQDGTLPAIRAVSARPSQGCDTVGDPGCLPPAPVDGGVAAWLGLRLRAL